MAECMGLHRDGETYGLTPLETHVRRLVWHQLCFLDIRTCEAQGPKPVIRREDYDTKLPVNCDEEDLLATAGAPPPEPSDSWTTNTLALIRFEINEMMRAVWVDRRRLETRRTTLTAVLTKIENFRQRMSEKYDPLLDMSLPQQRYAKCIMYLLTYRLHIMVLHPYYANALHPMPPRLSHLLITSGIMVIELAIQVETNPLFQDWAWYMGAYFQFQIAILLATEVYFRPQTREADRIWSCLDYVFGLDRKLAPETKCMNLLSEISSRTAVYMRKRKMRGPSTTARAAVSANAVAGTSPPPPPPLGQHHQPQHQTTQKQPVQVLHQQCQHTHHHRHSSTCGCHVPPYGSTNGGMKAEPSYPSPLIPVGTSTMPPSQAHMVFAGVSDGQVLWSLPPNAGSPHGSDSSSLAPPLGGAIPSTATVPASAAAVAGVGGAIDSSVPHGNIMDGIDWVSDDFSLPSLPSFLYRFPKQRLTAMHSRKGYHVHALPQRYTNRRAIHPRLS